MKRRQLLLSAATAAPCLVIGKTGEAGVVDYESPYEEIDWDTWETVDSMSHQHQGTTDKSREIFHAMGYRHFAFSNYYPSAPTLLSDSFRETHADVTWAPNAEQHSFLDSSLHFNSLGSRLETGFGKYVSSAERKTAPINHRFEGIRIFDKVRPWEGVYRLDIKLKRLANSSDETEAATLIIDGAHACDRKEDFADKGPVNNRSIAAENHTIYLRTQSDSIEIQLNFDSEKLEVTQLRLMQGSNRPWRDVFLAALDGETREGESVGGLIDPEGGGITLNHPGGKMDTYLEMLDFDSRVLGLEVWNQLTSGFGSNGKSNHLTKPPSHFYQLWDEVLSTGRRCWGFFVKDHNTYGRGRNILMAPPLASKSSEERESTLLRAYRKGAFFGAVSSIASDEEGNVVAPFDQSNFRFRHIRLRRDGSGKAVAVEVAVAGNDEKLRPNIQIRFVTDQGIVSIVNGSEGEFTIPSEKEDSSPPRFIRVEAFAYPKTHNQGELLHHETMSKLDVAEISQIRDKYAKKGATSFGSSAQLRTPIPIVDQIFSQPILRKT